MPETPSPSVAPLAIGCVPASPIGRDVDAALRAFFVAMPKVELHCHLLGTVRKETFLDLVAKYDAPLERAEIEAFYTRGERPVGVLRVLRALEDYLLMTPEDLRRITYEYLEDAARESVRHAEFFWNPTATIRDGRLPYAKAVAGILQGMDEAEADFGISSLLIPSIDREAPAEEAVFMVEEMIAHPHPKVVGIGIDYREDNRPPEMFAKAYALAKEHGLRTTAHAGEFGMPWTNVAMAIDTIGVDRVDHGYTIIDNPELARDYAARGLVFTIVPTNSYYLRTLEHERWALDHPIRRMAEMGLKLHPNSDDPTLHQVTPAGAWQLLYSHLGLELTQLREMMLNGIEGSWAGEDQRAQWSATWPGEFDALLARALQG
ncbi:adenosine deaminase [Novosphingobium mangrovi (ex Hu et al. 2023)]|uniref:Adenosine deaminase n=1 Tax=Novosphingobium mangrovi (ex Hu et al. 2023) TaxID=2930094 RepID=A0ABT0AGD0_9SPHN|nr:adenosine deaminase [Novosphingobium mangrovi (ex Hu et al. 2023)]MCJ1962272.1 adenosine deaminase [Novosphingobium mangrovi (ex Hu et al. 2023)]